jgi:zeaxanthin glucosyltransferase
MDVRTVPGTGPAQLEQIIGRAARPNGLFGILRTVSDTARLTDSLCRHAPTVLRSLQVDAILGDQMEPAAGLIARHLNVPMLSVACALPVERDPFVPLPFLPWPYDPTEQGAKRNRGGDRVARLLLTAQRRMITRWSHRFALSSPCETIEDCLSPLGTIAQTTANFDFPRQPTQKPLHLVGPIRRGGRAGDISFTIDPGKPFIFMSLGTLQGHRYGLFRTVARACENLGVQLLVAHCGGLTEAEARRLGATWATDFVDQRAVLKQADLCITHGGLNTVMDTLEFGKPLLVLPIAFDQPGVGARIEHHGVGLKLSRHMLSRSRVEKAIRTLLENRHYRVRAQQVGQSVQAGGGLGRAVEIIEQLLPPAAT